MEDLWPVVSLSSYVVEVFDHTLSKTLNEYKNGNGLNRGYNKTVIIILIVL